MNSKLNDISDEELVAQVRNQHKVVVHMLTTLTNIYSSYSKIMPKLPRGLIEDCFEESLEMMNFLGDDLNARDAILEEDSWISLVFEKAKGYEK